MGDAGTLSVFATDTLTAAGVQTVTGAKTFNDQKLLLRSPADTFTTTIINPAVSAARNLTMPAITANDTLMALALSQNVTGAKTFFDTTLIFRNALNTFSGTVINPLLTASKFMELGYTSSGNYIVYKSGTNYVAKNLDNHTIDYRSSATAAPETAIQTAITNAGAYGTVIIHGFDSFPLSASFTGFNLLYRQQIIMGHGARIVVPNGYTGTVFNLYESNVCQQVNFHGGMISETGTPQRLWTCFDFNSTTSAGMWANQIRDTRIINAGVGIKLRTDTNGWTNGNTFDSVFFDKCNIGVEWAHTGTFTAFLSGGNQNMFNSVIVQGDASVTYGFKNVNGRRNMFLNDYVADFTGGQITCNMTANAANTQIIGGSVTALNFADLSPSTTPTLIRDAYQNTVDYVTKILSYEDQLAITAPASPSTGTVRKYAKTVDSNNDGLFVKRKINGAVVEVQL